MAESIVTARLGKGLVSESAALTDAVSVTSRFIAPAWPLEAPALPRFHSALPSSHSGLQFFAGRVPQHDAVNATDAVGLKMHCVLAADDQRVSSPVASSHDLIAHSTSGSRGRRKAEAPVTLQRGMHTVSQAG